MSTAALAAAPVRRIVLAAPLALILATAPGPVWALATAFTEEAAFLSALPGPATTLDFEGAAAETLLPSGSTLDGVIFSYSIAGLSMKVSDAFDTTSGQNSLGLTGGDEAFLDGDEIDLSFAPVNALGMFFITSDAAVAAEIQLVTAVGTALGSGVSEAVLGDGGIVYFLGLISTDPFSAAAIDFANDGEINFTWNLDDVTTAVPEPRTALLVGGGLLGLAALGKPPRRGRGNASDAEPKQEFRLSKGGL